MRTLGRRTPPIVALPGFRPPRWLMLGMACLMAGLWSHPAHAQVRPENDASTAKRAPAGRYVPGEVLVEVVGQPSSAALDALAARHGLTPVHSHTTAITNSTWHLWRIADDRPVATVVRALAAERSVRSAQPNYRFVLP